MLNRVLRVTLAASLLSCAAFAADISGAWQFTLETAKGKGSPSFEFKQDGEKLTGTYSGSSERLRSPAPSKATRWNSPSMLRTQPGSFTIPEP
jgi:hypothetical protein